MGATGAGGPGEGRARVSAEDIFGSSPFAQVEGPSRARLAALFRPAAWAPRAVLIRPGTAPSELVLIGAGRVRLDRRDESGERTIDQRGPGDVVGEAALVRGRGGGERAVVVDAVEGLVAPVAALRTLMEGDAGARLAVVAALVDSLRAAEDRLAVLRLGGVRARLADALVRAVDRWGAPHEKGRVVAVAMTHSELARLVGSTRETTTLVLARLRDEGLVLTERRRFVVPDRAKLAACAAGA